MVLKSVFVLVSFLQSSDTGFNSFTFTLLAILLVFYQHVSTFCFQTNFFRYAAASSNVNLGKDSVSIKKIALLQISISSNHYYSIFIILVFHFKMPSITLIVVSFTVSLMVDLGIQGLLRHGGVWPLAVL